MARQVGMSEERLAGLSKQGDERERLSAVVDFELFRQRRGEARTNVGRPLRERKRRGVVAPRLQE